MTGLPAAIMACRRWRDAASRREKVKAMGCALILTDGSRSCALRPMADEFVHLDTFDIAGNSAASGCVAKPL